MLNILKTAGRTVEWNELKFGTRVPRNCICKVRSCPILGHSAQFAKCAIIFSKGYCSASFQPISIKLYKKHGNQGKIQVITFPRAFLPNFKSIRRFESTSATLRLLLSTIIDKLSWFHLARGQAKCQDPWASFYIDYPGLSLCLSNSHESELRVGALVHMFLIMWKCTVMLICIPLMLN